MFYIKIHQADYKKSFLLFSKVLAGDKVIIMSYAQMEREEVNAHPPKVVFVDENNRIASVARYEAHGALGTGETSC